MSLNIESLKDREEDGCFDLNNWRNRRLLDALMYAERLFPGISRDIAGMIDHEGILKVVWATNHCWPYGPDTMKAAWAFIGENATDVENVHAVDLDVEVPTT